MQSAVSICCTMNNETSLILSNLDYHTYVHVTKLQLPVYVPL